jgi:putative ABC transport system permease protein
MSPTTNAYLSLGYDQVALAALLVLTNGAISVAFDLGLGRRLLVAALRTIVQLLLVGLVLQLIFDLEHPLPILALMALMAVVAGIAAVGRSEHRYPFIHLDAVISVWLSSWIVAGVALAAVVRVEPWYRPQYAIPFLGMILGNTLTGISLGLGNLTESLRTQRDSVEMILSLGGTRWEAARPLVRRAVRTGMVPILNSMSVVGLVSLPGMMTGQILAGVAPVEAVKYQIVIMFVIASGTALGTLGVVLLAFCRLFNARHQLRAERLR